MELNDLQVNGFANEKFYCNFWQCPDDESIIQLSEFLYKEGVTSYLATLITDSYDGFNKNLKRIQEFRSRHYSSKEEAHAKKLSYISGVHMEGGLISRVGVHPEKYSSEINFKNASELIKNFPDLIKLWTLCPMKDLQGEVTRATQDSGIEVSYGHSEADYETSINAFEKYNVRLVTHWGNAMKVMKGFKQRDCSTKNLSNLERTDLKTEDLGLGYAAYHHPEVSCMAICGSEEDHDLHLDPRLFKQLAEKKKEKLIFVSDMVAYTGKLPPAHLVGGLASLKKHYENFAVIANQR